METVRKLVKKTPLYLASNSLRVNFRRSNIVTESQKACPPPQVNIIFYRWPFLSERFSSRRNHFGSVSLVNDFHFETDLSFSTFALSEMPRRQQMQIENQKFWNAKTLFLAGQLKAEAPQFGWVGHGEVVGALMEQYKHIEIERFHIGQTYLLQATQAGPDSDSSTPDRD